MSKRKENLTFVKLQRYELFVTGPGDRVYLKLDDAPALGGSIAGGFSIELAERRHVWVPENRVVARPTRTNFKDMADHYLFEQDCRAAQAAQETQEA